MTATRFQFALVRHRRRFFLAAAQRQYPQGGVLACRRCDFTAEFWTDGAALFLAVGWPEHCGEIMDVTPPSDGGGEGGE